MKNQSMEDFVPANAVNKYMYNFLQYAEAKFNNTLPYITDSTRDWQNKQRALTDAFSLVLYRYTENALRKTQEMAFRDPNFKPE